MVKSERNIVILRTTLNLYCHLTSCSKTMKTEQRSLPREATPFRPAPIVWLITWAPKLTKTHKKNGRSAHVYMWLPHLLTPVGLTMELRAISSVASAVRCRWRTFLSHPLKLQMSAWDGLVFLCGCSACDGAFGVFDRARDVLVEGPFLDGGFLGGCQRLFWEI